jgi:hypothetical protein
MKLKEKTREPKIMMMNAVLLLVSFGAVILTGLYFTEDLKQTL